MCDSHLQLCLSVVAAVAAENSSSVVVVDTGSGFTATRLQDMLVWRGEESSRAMQRVSVYHIFSVFELLTLIETLHLRIAQQVDHFHSSMHLLVIDSITSLLSPLLGGLQLQGMCWLWVI